MTDQALMDAICPLAERIFCCPVQTSCGHTFEYARILQLLGNYQPCPCPVAGCQHALEIENLVLNCDRMIGVAQVAEEVFTSLEELLRQFNRGGNRADLCDRGLVRHVAAAVRDGHSLLAEEEEVIAGKIRGRALSEEEGYALAYFIIQQFAPFDQWIRNVRFHVDRFLIDLAHRQATSFDTRGQLLRQLNQWHVAFSPLLGKGFLLCMEFIGSGRSGEA